MKTLLHAVLTLSFAISTGAATPRECSDLKERARRLRAPEVPAEVVALYNSLAVLPRYQQQNLVEHFAPALKQALWSHHLRSFGQGASLTTDQRALIDDALAFLDEETLDGDERGVEATARRQQRLDHLRHRAESVFPREVTYKIFSSLGSAEMVESTLKTTKRPDSNEPCNCATWYDCSPIWPSVICNTVVACIPTNYRCGFFWTDPCIGLC